MRSLVLLWARGISCRPSWEFGFALCALPSVSSDGAHALRVASWAEGVEFLDRMMYYHSFGFWMGSIHQLASINSQLLLRGSKGTKQRLLGPEFESGVAATS